MWIIRPLKKSHGKYFQPVKPASILVFISEVTASLPVNEADLVLLAAQLNLKDALQNFVRSNHSAAKDFQRIQIKMAANI